MPFYYGKQKNSSDQGSDRYVHINNCGFCERITQMRVDRPAGRADHQLIYVKSGALTFVFEDRSITLGEGCIFLYRPGDPQRYFVSSPSASYFWIHFTGTEIPRMIEFFEDVCYKIGPFPEFERFCRSFYADFQLAKRHNEMRFEGELIVLLARLSELIAPPQNSERDYSKISQAVLAMHDAFPRRADNEALAALCGISKYYFIKLFKSATGTTPQQYYMTMLMDKSKLLLTNTSHTVGEIAAQCGIEDALYFSRLFKRHVGCSPSEYRQKHG